MNEDELLPEDGDGPDDGRGPALAQRVHDLGEEIGVMLAELDARGATP